MNAVPVPDQVPNFVETNVVPKSFDVLKEHYEGLIRYAASINCADIAGLEFDDLYQEGLIVLNEHLQCISHLPFNEFNNFFKKSLFNEMQGIRRARFSQGRTPSKEAFSMDADEVPELSLVGNDLPDELAEASELLNYLKRELAPFDFEVLMHSVEPSEELSQQIVAETKLRRCNHVTAWQIATFLRRPVRHIQEAQWRIQELAKRYLEGHPKEDVAQDYLKNKFKN